MKRQKNKNKKPKLTNKKLSIDFVDLAVEEETIKYDSEIVDLTADD